MILSVQKSHLHGTLSIPGSKSHTIRALAIAAAADGTSHISAPLESADTEACIHACSAMGATITQEGDVLTITGFKGKPEKTDKPINVLNSGTTLRIMAGIAALANHTTTFDGDAQIRLRPMQPLLDALTKLSATSTSEKDTGMCPLTIKGPLVGGKTKVTATTSQFLSSLLIAAPLAPGTTEITVEGLNEKPYVEITLHWLKSQGVDITHTPTMDHFTIHGNHTYTAFDKRIPADFSSATFPACAAAITKSTLNLEGLDMDDPQGDKAVLSLLESMGASLHLHTTHVTITGKKLTGRTIDLNAMPDALPALAVLSCFAEGETIINNVPQARIKETDRIAVMATELKKMGADITELPDGLIIRTSKLHGTVVEGHHDHRIVMALSLAGMAASGITKITTAEAIAVTFPSYVKLMQNAGAIMELTE